MCVLMLICLVHKIVENVQITNVINKKSSENATHMVLFVKPFSEVKTYVKRCDKWFLV